MQDFYEEGVRELDRRSVLPIVVGAHLEAEVTDRAIAYRLREAVVGWDGAVREGAAALVPVVCTDLWYLNDQPLRQQPTITVGRPEVNAATAYLATRVPTSFVLEERFRIQMDPEGIDRRACVWGTDAATTADAVDLFRERYLDAYLRTAHGG